MQPGVELGEGTAGATALYSAFPSLPPSLSVDNMQRNLQ